MGAVGQADGGGGAADLLHRDHVFQITEAEPAPFLLHGDAKEPERAHFPPKLDRKLVGLVDGGGARRDALAREAPDAVPERLDLLA